MINRHRDLQIGIIANEAYSPSVLAAAYIKKVLASNGVTPHVFNIDDLIGDKVHCDLVFNVYYGGIGDGGIVSGLLDTQGIRYVGNSQYACSLMLNKVLAKRLFLNNGYATAPYWFNPNSQKSADALTAEVEAAAPYPLLAKPVNGAASENITFIADHSALQTFIIDNRSTLDSGYYFFEQFLRGREVSAGYVHALAKDLPVIEISLKGEQYQSNKVKFNPGFKENIIPAPLPKSVYQEAQHTAKNLGGIFDASAFVRVDMMYVENEQRLYLLEINTNPGLLETSLLPLMASHAGFEPDVFFSKLIEYHCAS